MTRGFQQSTGNLTKDGYFIIQGYAAKGKGKYKPDVESIPDIGPLPRGKYTIIGHPFHHSHTGTYSMRLQPAPHNKMFGRAGFLIYGDSKNHPGEASDGGIILPLLIRQRIWLSENRSIEVER
ncbi:DUF2778 domain-containing protein [Affinibrenneria salicis]|uniref:DUF2778 domain-containing protein n=1 Tax=Affinibrenneria salicis TaxID=2590031 RepID=A0A5J5FRZ5_9GAMM|nr:DUF2778 domain-containing protein [Affinibrenneria salicis]KAA8995629.1 DUF2778 domain-containing protein [Affinibrenneria salicis]